MHYTVQYPTLSLLVLAVYVQLVLQLKCVLKPNCIQPDTEAAHCVQPSINTTGNSDQLVYAQFTQEEI